MPSQRININICSIPSYDPKISVLRNHYGVDMGTANLLLNIESREEIFADKIVAFALRPNRIKSRDLWDIVWLTQQGVQLSIELVSKKMTDHQQQPVEFAEKLMARKQALKTDILLKAAFQQEMRRFLPPEIVKSSIDSAGFWDYLKQVVTDACDSLDKQPNTPYKL